MCHDLLTRGGERGAVAAAAAAAATTAAAAARARNRPNTPGRPEKEGSAVAIPSERPSAPPNAVSFF